MGRSDWYGLIFGFATDRLRLMSGPPLRYSYERANTLVSPRIESTGGP